MSCEGSMLHAVDVMITPKNKGRSFNQLDFREQIVRFCILRNISSKDIHRAAGVLHSHSRSCNTSVNSRHQHPQPGLTPGEFFKVVKFPAPENFYEITAPRQKIDKNPAPGDNFVDLQDNFAMIVKPFAFFLYSSLAWLSSSFFKDYKACEYKISQ